MISDSETTEAVSYKKLISDAMFNVIAELQLADPMCVIVMIGSGQSANIADLVESSTELYFLRGTLRYGMNADCCVLWHNTPVVRFDMEFRHANVCAFFRIVVGKTRADVEVQDVLFDEDGLDMATKQERLAAALRSARI
jgi:hypothetical protein